MFTFVFSFINWQKQLILHQYSKLQRSWLSEIGNSAPHNWMFASSRSEIVMIMLLNSALLSGLYLPCQISRSENSTISFFWTARTNLICNKSMCPRFGDKSYYLAIWGLLRFQVHLSTFKNFEVSWVICSSPCLAVKDYLVLFQE